MYLGLAQSQQHVEKFIIENVNSTNLVLFKRMFFPYLNNLNKEILKYLKKVKVEIPYLPKEIENFVPSIKASNNWAISKEKSESGAPLFASDPHLEVNKAPSLWYEVKTYQNETYAMGATIPGYPLICFGRNNHLTWGFTYGTADMIDYFM